MLRTESRRQQLAVSTGLRVSTAKKPKQKNNQPAVRTGWENEKRFVPCDIIISGEVD